MILSQEYHQVHPSDNDIFRVTSNKTRLICFISLLRINSFCQDCYENHWWWNTVSVNSKAWVVTERHDFLSLMFRFVVCVCVSACVCVLLFCSCLHFYSYSRIIEVCYVYYLFYLNIAFTHLVEKMGIQITEIQKNIIQKQNKR